MGSPKISPLWISNNGRITCVKHGGAYLDAAIRMAPRKSTHVTPLDHWTRATTHDRVAWIRAGLGVMRCEECPAEAPLSAATAPK